MSDILTPPKTTRVHQAMLENSTKPGKIYDKVAFWRDFYYLRCLNLLV